MARRRRYKVADVSQEAQQGWKRFARAHDVTTSSLVEAIGLWLGQNDDAPKHRLPAQLRKCIDRALEITYENRQRGNCD